ncbi:MAG: DUF4384 domain-containing protein [Chromatiales bacterium]|nr:DUF4384 domain-containing protein [Chromatiales bacterium]
MLDLERRAAHGASRRRRANEAAGRVRAHRPRKSKLPPGRGRHRRPGGDRRRRILRARQADTDAGGAAAAAGAQQAPADAGSRTRWLRRTARASRPTSWHACCRANRRPPSQRRRRPLPPSRSIRSRRSTTSSSSATATMRYRSRIDRAKARIGRDKLRFRLNSTQPGYLYLLMVGTDRNHFYLLFPNAGGQEQPRRRGAGDSACRARLGDGRGGARRHQPLRRPGLGQSARLLRRRTAAGGSLRRVPLQKAEKIAQAAAGADLSPFAGKPVCPKGGSECSAAYGRRYRSPSRKWKVPQAHRPRRRRAEAARRTQATRAKSRQPARERPPEAAAEAPQSAERPLVLPSIPGGGRASPQIEKMLRQQQGTQRMPADAARRAGDAGHARSSTCRAAGTFRAIDARANAPSYSDHRLDRYPAILRGVGARRVERLRYPLAHRLEPATLDLVLLGEIVDHALGPRLGQVQVAIRRRRAGRRDPRWKT